MRTDTDGDLLADNPLFSAVPAARRRALVADAEHRELPAGARILTRGAPATHAYLLERGRVRVFHTLTGGLELTIKAFSAPALFGEAELLAGVPLAQSAMTLTPVALLAIGAARFRALLEEEPSFARALCFDLGARLTIASHDERAIASAPAIARLAGYLLDHARWMAGDDAILRVDLTQEQMARAIGVSRRSVAEHVGDWVADRILLRRAQGYELARPERLAELADPDRPRLHYSLSSLDLGP